MLIPIALTALVSLALGLPLGWVLRRAEDGVAALTAEALVLGYVLLALAPTLFGWLGFPGLILFAVAWFATVVLTAVRHPPWPQLQHMDTRSGVLVASAVVVAVVAVVLRLHNDNFTPWVGDMGAYVNWGNQFARTGVLSATWPPLFPSYLALSSWVFGPAETTASLGLAGLVLIVAASRLLSMMRVNRWIVLLVAGIITVNVHAIWYSYFPASEALSAPYYLAWLLTIVGSIRAARPGPWLAANAVVVLALGLVRGTGPFVLGPLIILVLLAIVVPEWRWFARRSALLFTAGLAGSVPAYWYGISRIPQYFVEQQFRTLVPARLADLLQYRLHVFDPTPLTAIVLVLVVAGVALVATRIPAPPDGQWTTAGKSQPRSRVPLILGWLLAGILVLGLGAAARVHAGGWLVLERIGLEFVILAVLAVAIAGLKRVDPFIGAFILMVGTVAVVFIGLQTYRLKHLSDHAFFLYWDRYFVSEVLPSLFILSGFAIDAVYRIVSAQPRVPRQLTSVARSIPAMVTTGLLVIGALAVADRHNLRLVTTDSYMRGAYAFQTALDAQIPNTRIPVLWTESAAGRLPGFFFPNTWMAFARPMQTSFGYNVRDIAKRDNFGPDVVADAALVDQTFACTGTRSIVVFEVRTGGPDLAQRITDERFRITHAAVVGGSISLLSQPPTNGGWQHLSVTVDVWDITLVPGASQAVCTRP